MGSGFGFGFGLGLEALVARLACGAPLEQCAQRRRLGGHIAQRRAWVGVGVRLEG